MLQRDRRCANNRENGSNRNAKRALAGCVVSLALSSCYTTTVYRCELPPAPQLEGEILDGRLCFTAEEVADLASWLEGVYVRCEIESSSE